MWSLLHYFHLFHRSGCEVGRSESPELGSDCCALLLLPYAQPRGRRTTRQDPRLHPRTSQDCYSQRKINLLFVRLHLHEIHYQYWCYFVKWHSNSILERFRVSGCFGQLPSAELSSLQSLWSGKTYPCIKKTEQIISTTVFNNNNSKLKGCW